MLMINIESELVRLREAGRIVALVHRELKKEIKVGVTTLELNDLARAIIEHEGGESAFLGYKGFPATICTSINDVIVHGIPNNKKLKDGDLISVDVGCKKEGFFGDAAFSVQVGNKTRMVQALIKASEGALNAAIEVIKEGTTTGTIGRVIEEYSQSCGFYVVKNYIGHGISKALHMEPAIYNYGRDIEGPKLKSGVCLCVEPMLCIDNANNHRLVDGWTVVTDNGKLSCHVEHQIIVHKDHAEVITI